MKDILLKKREELITSKELLEAKLAEISEALDKLEVKIEVYDELIEELEEEATPEATPSEVIY